jgi:hypothetical protein
MARDRIERAFVRLERVVPDAEDVREQAVANERFRSPTDEPKAAPLPRRPIGTTLGSGELDRRGCERRHARLWLRRAD